MVCLIIAPSSSRPPRHAGGTRQALMGGLPYSVCVSFNYFVFPGFIARSFRGMGVGFEEPHLRFMVVTRLSLGRRNVNHLPVAQRTNALTNGVVDIPWVVGREFESHVHHENAFQRKVNFLMSRI